MKKKMFAIAMASVMAASLTACGGGEKETTAAATEAATTAAETSAEAEESETAAEGESAAEAAAEVTTVNEGKLTVATSRTLLPMSFMQSARMELLSWPASIWLWLSTSQMTWDWNWR